jgi:hypothetical protein
MSDIDLLALGFSQGDDGVLVAPKDSRTRLVPLGKYFEIRIGVDGGNAVCVVVPRVAIKIARAGAPTEAAIDPEAMITNTVRHRPW